MKGKLINWVWDALARYYEKKCKREIGGIPMLWAIYKTDSPPPNIFFSVHPCFNGDEWLSGRFKEIADYMREHYKEESHE